MWTCYRSRLAASAVASARRTAVGSAPTAARRGPPWLGLDAVAAAVGVSRRTLYRWRSAPPFAAAVEAVHRRAPSGGKLPGWPRPTAELTKRWPKRSVGCAAPGERSNSACREAS